MQGDAFVFQRPPWPLDEDVVEEPVCPIHRDAHADQAAVEKRIKEICEARVRYGYRRVHVLLDREGWGTNIKKVYRI